MNINEDSPLTPEISFCDFNQFLTKYGIELYQNKSIEFNSVNDIGNDSTDKIINFQNKKVFTNNYFFTLNRTFLKSLINPLENKLVTCVFNGFKCSADDFIWYRDIWYGNCFKFNTNLLKNSKIFNSGDLSGLQVDLLLPDPQNSIGSGLHIIINNVKN